ncbi:MAG: hypothetical protein J4G01_07080 [Dehalococcoidia bacterium]|nr:hypothetical protein [Dehalococcoidia bacterium]
MHDAITVEKAGKPAAAICTEPFVPTGRSIAKIRGIDGYPFAVVTHPVGSVEDGVVMERAHQALPRVLEILLAK